MMNLAMHQSQSTSWALVTGGAIRVGKIFSLELARLGFNVVIHYFQDEIHARETAELVKAMGRDAILVQADLRDPEQIDRAFSEIGNIARPLQLVINSAAVMPAGKLSNLSVAEWENVFDLNLRAPLLCARAAIKWMAPGGLIIYIGDEFAQQDWKTYPAYGLTKACLVHLTRILAREVEPDFRVAGLALGPVLPPEGYSRENWDKIISRSEYKFAIEPAAIGQALAMMIDSEYISGKFLTVKQLLDNDLPGSQEQA